MSDSRLDAVRESIRAASIKAKRAPSDVTLIAVTKTHTAEEIAPLIAAGVTDFGESRVQEAALKWPALRAADPGLRLHMIGRLQSNKAAEAIDLFDTIHSLDRVSLLDALVEAGTRAGRFPDCFVQINVGEELQKGGVAPSELAKFLVQVRASPIPLAGLMCIPPADMEPSPFFAFLNELARRHDVAGLSMGMSADYEQAVMLGSTHVRVGSALFA